MLYNPKAVSYQENELQAWLTQKVKHISLDEEGGLNDYQEGRQDGRAQTARIHLRVKATSPAKES